MDKKFKKQVSELNSKILDILEKRDDTIKLSCLSSLLALQCINSEIPFEEAKEIIVVGLKGSYEIAEKYR